MSQLFPRLLHRLDMIVFEQTGDGGFQALTPLPLWYADLHEAGEPDSIETFSPFVDNFLVDARAHWESGLAAPLSSGIWSAGSNANDLQQLECQALRIDSRSLLILSNISHQFRERQHVLQTAREIALENERLMHALNMRQRQLSELLAKKLRGTDDEPARKHHLEQGIQQESNAVFICDADGQPELSNRAFRDIYEQGVNFNARQSLLARWLEEASEYYPELERAIATGKVWEGEFESRDSHGELRWIHLNIRPVQRGDESISHYVCIANDLSAIRQAAQNIEQKAELDYTTHLPNRHSFFGQAQRMLDQAAATATRMALIHLDLNDFRHINDQWGHHAGDFLLCTLASRLSNAATANELLAHLGGDEFALLSPVTDADQALMRAAALQQELLPPVRFGGTQIRLEASVGVALFPQQGDSVSELMKKADLAMYAAKRSQSTNALLYQADWSLEPINRFKLENEMFLALGESQFRLLYQPFVPLAGSNHPLRLEALIRWTHPQRGEMLPDAFIPVAERSGLINDIGTWVLNQVCADLQELRRRVPTVRVAINISARQLQDERLLTRLQESVTRYGVEAAQLELEITETALMEDLDNASGVIQALRSLGVSVSLDDFGAGYTSLNQLKTLPVNTIKIDRSFTRDLPAHAESAAITQSVIQLAHQLGMDVVAEGVEHQEQLNLLQQQGCDFVQGYLIYRPAALPELLQDLPKFPARVTDLTER